MKQILKNIILIIITLITLAVVNSFIYINKTLKQKQLILHFRKNNYESFG